MSGAAGLRVFGCVVWWGEVERRQGTWGGLVKLWRGGANCGALPRHRVADGCGASTLTVSWEDDDRHASDEATFGKGGAKLQEYRYQSEDEAFHGASRNHHFTLGTKSIRANDQDPPTPKKKLLAS